MSSSRGSGLPFLVMLAVLVAPIGLPLAEADEFASVLALPSPRRGGSAVWADEVVYVIGGAQAATTFYNDILRVDPASGSVTVAATLPTPLVAMAAFWDGAAVHILGGRISGVASSAILKFDPATGTVTQVAAMPVARSSGSVTWTGTFAYYFTGADVIRYDPATGDATMMSAKFSPARERTTAVYDGSRYSYIFGGIRPGSIVPNADVTRYDPVTDSLTLVASAALPDGWYDASAAFDGRYAYLFGGTNTVGGNHHVDTVTRYDTQTNGLALAEAKLPSARTLTMAVWARDHALVIGGSTTSAVLTDVLAYRLTPGAPRNVTATTGPGAGTVTLTWLPPSATSHPLQVDEYRIYAGAAAGAEALLATVAGDTTSFSDTGLANGQTRSYRLSAVNAFGEGKLIASIAGRAAAPPSPPRSLTAQPVLLGPVLLGSVQLDWVAPSDTGGIPVTHHRIYRSIDGAPSDLLAEVGNTTTYRDTTCPVAATCEYRVSALHAAGESVRSNAASAIGLRIR